MSRNGTRRHVSVPWMIALVLGVILGILHPRESRAAVTFVFNYTDATGVGFNAPGQTGVDRRAGLELAADYVEAALSAYTATIMIDVSGSQTDDNTLASASSNFSSPFPGFGFGDRGDVMVKILGGADPAPTLADGSIDWNFEDFTWEPFNDFQPGELDFYSTAVHELTHALGFGSGIFQNGSSAWGDPAGTPSAWEPFDRYMADSSGALIDGAFALDGTRWNSASVGGTGPANGLFFIGPNAMAANGGNPVPLYSPTTWDPGSSASHLDTDFFLGVNAQLMNHAPSVAHGLDIREWSDIEIGMLRDIGYTQVVPEPGTGLLLLLAAASCLVIRRLSRRRAG